jgi:hypothetical protein
MDGLAEGGGGAGIKGLKINLKIFSCGATLPCVSSDNARLARNTSVYAKAGLKIQLYIDEYLGKHAQDISPEFACGASGCPCAVVKRCPNHLIPFPIPMILLCRCLICRRW